MEPISKAHGFRLGSRLVEFVRTPEILAGVNEKVVDSIVLTVKRVVLEYLTTDFFAVRLIVQLFESSCEKPVLDQPRHSRRIVVLYFLLRSQTTPHRLLTGAVYRGTSQPIPHRTYELTPTGARA